MSKVAILGSGPVAKALEAGFTKHGHEVKQASRTGFAEATAWSELVVLAVKGAAALEALALAGHDNLAGKTVIDTTNPIANAAPDNGVLRFFTDLDESLMERLQKAVPAARFVKAFSCVGNAFMVDPKFPGGPPTMFICGNDAAAKAEVTAILAQFGWDTADMGGVEGARAIEPLCILWCIPGLRGGAWTHALKLLRL